MIYNQLFVSLFGPTASCKIPLNPIVGTASKSDRAEILLCPTFAEDVQLKNVAEGNF